jgi:hypothetical protein
MLSIIVLGFAGYTLRQIVFSTCFEYAVSFT